MITFLEFAAIVLVTGIALSLSLDWIKRQHVRWSGLATLVLASGAAYAGSFALDMIVGACIGFYKFSPLTLPIFTWTGIAIALHSYATSLNAHRGWIVTPYLVLGGLAFVMGMIGPHRYSVLVGLPLILIGVLLIYSKLPESDRPTPLGDGLNS